MVEQQLHQAESGGSSPTSPLQVQEITLKEAKPFILKWHYSHVVPTGKNIFFGWFQDGTLYAVADYGVGVNPYQAAFLNRTVGTVVVMPETLVELKRLCRSEPKRESMPLTKFLKICHGLLRKRGYAGVVSFSDPEQGHSGGIYKAANFAHLGTTNPEWHVVGADGVKRHRRYPYRYAKRNGVDMKTARDELGLTRVQTKPKDRWFLNIAKPSR